MYIIFDLDEFVSKTVFFAIYVFFRKRIFAVFVFFCLNEDMEEFVSETGDVEEFVSVTFFVVFLFCRTFFFAVFDFFRLEMFFCRVFCRIFSDWK